MSIEDGSQIEEQINPAVWEQWDLAGLLKGLDLARVPTGHPGLATTVLFLTLQDHGWPGELALFRRDEPDILQSLEIQHTCLKWNDQVLDINGHDHAAFAASQELDPKTRFIPMGPRNGVTTLAQGMPNLHQTLKARVQGLLIRAQTPVVSPAEVSARPRL